MEEQLISFETAKLAKEKGFDWICRVFYEDWDNNELHEPISPSDFNNEHVWEKTISAPTQSLLQKWLREVHDIKMCVSYTCVDDSEYAYIWEITTNCEKGRKKDSWDFNKRTDSFSIMSWWDT